MKKIFFFMISLAMILCAVGEAKAATVRWCFRFTTDYDYDWNNNEDYLLPEEGYGYTYVDASYVDTTLFECADSSCNAPAPTISWSGNLDADGCTPLFTTTTGSHKFRFFSRSKALTPDDRHLIVLPDGERFGEWDVEVEDWTATYSFVAGYNEKTPTIQFPANIKHLMGVGCTALKRRLYSRWAEGTDVWMSANTDESGGPDCGTYSEDGGIYNGGDHRYYVCIDINNLTKKFIIGHQLGDVFALMNEGLHSADHSGSEGNYRASGIGGRCDCDTMYPAPNTRSFCLGSREFTGAAQKEGYASFQSAVIMNNRSSDYGVFVNDYRVMNWSNVHGGRWSYVLPGVSYWNPPFIVTLNDATRTRWMEYECNPTGDFQHFATEWDWAEFFWSIWAEGGTSNRYDVSDMNVIWYSYPGSGDPLPPEPQIAELCCTTPDPETHVPLSCKEHNRNSAYDCDEGDYFGYPETFTVGKLWTADPEYGATEGILEDAQDMFQAINPSKYQHFLDTGDATGVNH